MLFEKSLQSEFTSGWVCVNNRMWTAGTPSLSSQKLNTFPLASLIHSALGNPTLSHGSSGWLDSWSFFAYEWPVSLWTPLTVFYKLQKRKCPQSKMSYHKLKVIYKKKKSLNSWPTFFCHPSPWLWSASILWPKKCLTRAIHSAALHYVDMMG